MTYLRHQNFLWTFARPARQCTGITYMRPSPSLDTQITDQVWLVYASMDSSSSDQIDRSYITLRYYREHALLTQSVRFLASLTLANKVRISFEIFTSFCLRMSTCTDKLTALPQRILTGACMQMHQCIPVYTCSNITLVSLINSNIDDCKSPLLYLASMRDTCVSKCSDSSSHSVGTMRRNW